MIDSNQMDWNVIIPIYSHILPSTENVCCVQGFLELLVITVQAPLGPGAHRLEILL